MKVKVYHPNNLIPRLIPDPISDSTLLPEASTTPRLGAPGVSPIDVGGVRRSRHLHRVPFGRASSHDGPDLIFDSLDFLNLKDAIV